jgi:4-hydroxybenzoate polyprenyltransferase
MLVYVFTSTIYGVSLDPLILGASFMVTLAVYTLNMITDKSEDEINRGNLIISDRYFQGIAVLSIFTAILICSLINIKALLIISIPVFTGVLYCVKIYEKVPRMKEVLGIKSILVATSWALTGALLPSIKSYVDFTSILLMFFYIFLQLLINTILFDILDMKGDYRTGIETIPLYFGREKTRKLLHVINSVLLVLCINAYIQNLYTSYFPVFIFGVLYGYVLIENFCGEKTSRIMNEIFIDGEWIPQVALLLLL